MCDCVSSHRIAGCPLSEVRCSSAIQIPLTGTLSQWACPTRNVEAKSTSDRDLDAGRDEAQSFEWAFCLSIKTTRPAGVSSSSSSLSLRPHSDLRPQTFRANPQGIYSLLCLSILQQTSSTMQFSIVALWAAALFVFGNTAPVPSRSL